MRRRTDVAAMDRVAEAHAQHIVAANRVALQQDCNPDLLQTPADLDDRLCAAVFDRYNAKSA